MHYVFLTACRNEQRILPQFLDEYKAVLEQAGIADRSVLCVVDDLSTDDSARLVTEGARERGLTLRLIESPTNFGNQGAMFYGLQRVEVGPDDVLITFDCDGEDDVHSIPEILAVSQQAGGKLVLIERGRRQESLVFKVCFAIYKALFRFLTRKSVIPNNFMLIPGAHVPAIRRSPLAAVHLAYGVLKLGFPHEQVTRDRKARYGGRSSQNLFTLVSHGMVGLMVFYEVVVAKLFMLLFVMLAVGGGGTLGGLALPARYVEAHRVLSWVVVGAGLGMVGLLALLIASAVALIFKLGVFSLRQMPVFESPPGDDPAAP